MSTADKIETTFPGVQWTGGSGIHRSVAVSGLLNIPFEKRSLVLYMLLEKDFGGYIWEYLQARFGKMEWLTQRDVFAKLFMVDMDRQLQGKPTTETPDRIENPHTGNLFHRMALYPPLIGGVRFWAENYGGKTHIGFRFRIVSMKTNDEGEHVREESRLRESVVLEEIASVYDAVVEISEPPKEAVSTTEELVSLIKE